jgi:signal peptidase I
MLKKLLLSVSVVLACLFAFAIIARLAGVLQYYSLPTESNAPTFYPGDKVFAVKYKKPQRLDFVAFNRVVDDGGTQVWLHRLIGLPGDVVEIRKGEAFVNKVSVDGNLELTSEWRISTSDYRKRSDEINRMDKLKRAISRAGEDSVTYFWPDKLVRKLMLPATKVLQEEGVAEHYVSDVYNEAWNFDHFGPYKVPQGHYFVLGDNRHNAMDSRFIGPIREQDLVGTILGSH